MEELRKRIADLERDLAIVVRAVLLGQNALDGYWSLPDLRRIADRWTPPSAAEQIAAARQ